MVPASLYVGHVLDVLPRLPMASVQCVVTSPPYWGLRDYGDPPQVWGAEPACQHTWNDSPLPRAGRFCAYCDAWRGQLGLEPTPALYVEHLVAVFREARRLLRPDGTLWLNMGDCYATGAGSVGEHPGGGKQGAMWAGRGVHTVANAGKAAARLQRMGPMTQPNRMPLPGLKPKDLVMMPARVALALQADGWWLRSDIVWSKPNPMPESVTDRPTRAHEYVFLLSKSARYYYHSEAIAEPNTSAAQLKHQQRYARTYDKFDEKAHSRVPGAENSRGIHSRPGNPAGGRNARSVWSITTKPYPGAHFATFPPQLAERCILAGSRAGDTILDPFGGSGVTAAVAVAHGRRAIHVDVNPAYLALARERIGPLLCELSDDPTR